jgi:hypothetical protein
MCACHRNDDPQDNRLENLYWGTHQQNSEDAKRNDRVPKGERHYEGKLTAEQVRTIRQLLAQRTSMYKIAAQFGVCQGTIMDIAKGRIWKSVR